MMKHFGIIFLRSAKIVFLYLLAMAVVPAYAQDVNSNGTLHPHGITSSGLGTTIGTEGGTFDITGGTQKGSNLFHSFGKFNIHSGESAVFHDEGIENTIGRITGGEYSWINGILQSGAQNLYLLNPAGMMFGANASLDLQGSFHVSTADYLRLGENEKFFAEPIEGEVLSVAAPSAFGFLNKSENLQGFEKLQGLDNPIAPISFEGSGSAYAEENLGLNGIKVPEGKILSVIGGDIDLKSGMITDDIQVESRLKAAGGRMNIAAVASSGEVVPTETDLDVESFSRLGNITIADGSFATVTSEGAGNVYIRGGNFVIDNSNPSEYSEYPAAVYATSLGDTDGGGIDIRLRGDLSITNGGEIVSNGFGAGDGRQIRIESENVNLTNKGKIYSINDGSGKGTEISISAKDSIFVANNSYIAGKNEKDGEGWVSDIIIEAKKIILTDNCLIYNASSGSGQGGNIRLSATESIFMKGNSENENPLWVGSGTTGSGNSGTIEITTPDLYVGEGVVIIAGTAGNGAGGDIYIQVNRFQLNNGGWVNASSDKSGDTGNITIYAAESVSLENGAKVDINTQGSGQGGKIMIITPGTIHISGNKGSPAAITAMSYEGDGGEILLEAKDVYLIDGGMINTSTLGFGDAGKITIKADETIQISGEISGNIPSSIMSATLGEGAESGGDIFIEAKNICLLDGGIIIASTFGFGDGGKITIKADETVQIRGETSVGSPSSVWASTHGKETNAGDGSEIIVEANNIFLTDGGWITNGTSGSGQGGTIIVKANNSLIVSGSLKSGIGSTISAQAADGQGDSGDIILQVSKLEVSDNADINSESGAEENSGKAGTIIIAKIVEIERNEDGAIIHIEPLEPADTIKLENSGITTRGTSSGGGKIRIEVNDSLYLLNSEINTNVGRGEDKGGDINIGNTDTKTGPRSVILNHSNITANADEGDGGAIFIVTDNFIKSSDSKLSATSNRGNDGEIKVEAPDTDISGSLLILTGGMIDASRWLPVPCSHRTGDDVSRFFVTGFDAMPGCP